MNMPGNDLNSTFNQGVLLENKTGPDAEKDNQMRADISSNSFMEKPEPFNVKIDAPNTFDNKSNLTQTINPNHKNAVQTNDSPTISNRQTTDLNHTTYQTLNPQNKRENTTQGPNMTNPGSNNIKPANQCEMIR